MAALETVSGKVGSTRRPTSVAALALLVLCGLALAGCVVYPAGYYGHGPGYYDRDDGYRGHRDHDGDRHRGWDRD